MLEYPKKIWISIGGLWLNDDGKISASKIAYLVGVYVLSKAILIMADKGTLTDLIIWGYAAFVAGDKVRKEWFEYKKKETNV